MQNISWQGFEQKGYISLPSKGFINHELTQKTGVILPDLFKSPEKLYYHQKYQNIRETFYVDVDHPQNPDFLKLHQQCTHYVEQFLENYFSYKKWDDHLAKQMTQGHRSFLRPTLYHPHPVGTLLSEIHLDTSLITLLAGGSRDGLQVFDREQNRFVDIPTSHEVIIVKFGAIMEAWSNGEIKATPHRVISTCSSFRTSLPYFFHPSPTTKMNEKFPTFGSFYNFKAKEAMFHQAD